MNVWPDWAALLALNQHLAGLGRFLALNQHLTGLGRFLALNQHLAGLGRYLALRQHLLALTTAPSGLRALAGLAASWPYDST